MEERLQKYISRCGIASRRKAEEMMARGKVKVNGKIVREPGSKVDPAVDVVEVEGRKISAPTKWTYYALYKPTGYVSTVRDEHADKIVTELVPESPRVFPVGRLDRSSEGLMILTDDGELMNKLTHPGFSHEKEYRVDAEYEKSVSGEEVRRKVKSLEPGIRLFDGKTRPAEIHIEKIRDRSIRFRIILKEGKKRQIRRMCKAVDLKVKKLVRIRIANLRLHGLEPGEFRKITKKDITGD